MSYFVISLQYFYALLGVRNPNISHIQVFSYSSIYATKILERLYDKVSILIFKRSAMKRFQIDSATKFCFSHSDMANLLSMCEYFVISFQYFYALLGVCNPNFSHIQVFMRQKFLRGSTTKCRFSYSSVVR